MQSSLNQIEPPPASVEPPSEPPSSGIKLQNRVPREVAEFYHSYGYVIPEEVYMAYMAAPTTTDNTNATPS